MRLLPVIVVAVLTSVTLDGFDDSSSRRSKKATRKERPRVEAVRPKSAPVTSVRDDDSPQRVVPAPQLRRYTPDAEPRKLRE
jgi:hypothetical protein